MEGKNTCARIFSGMKFVPMLIGFREWVEATKMRGKMIDPTSIQNNLWKTLGAYKFRKRNFTKIYNGIK